MHRDNSTHPKDGPTCAVRPRAGISRYDVLMRNGIVRQVRLLMQSITSQKAGLSYL